MHNPLDSPRPGDTLVGMPDPDLRTIVLDVFAEVAPDADLAGIDESRAFHDQFDIDSVDFLNFVLALEQRLGVHIAETDYPRLSSLAGAVGYLEGLKAEFPGETAR